MVLGLAGGLAETLSRAVGFSPGAVMKAPR
jgi:hypothetical protein